MIEHILPHSVAVSESFDDVPEPGVLHPEEARLVENAVETRRREFTTARWCARQALTTLGLPAVPILPGRHGAPQWPDGVLGSITHCAGYRAAVVARAPGTVMLGIDAEPDAPLPEGVLEAIALPDEQRLVRKLRDTVPEVHWDRLLFSTKEAVYKSWYPFTGQRLEFEDADISFDLDTRAFTARIRLPYRPPAGGPAIDRLEGRWLASKGLLVTAIAVTSARLSGTGG
ncbi:4'-phosphopantetheinyl transferase family protein [Streptomyces sp. SP18CS02]|uniref:4'-phosphopantetheinyl transferase family protein n=1 Tax=Streptomyces sp. SP18CS02 TaxID=3002531 RepID=UPI002E7917B3|nr:4'-phosphopantetheinyl transferase superfamily protein [Streptomyces sp. SP18CS02]MEE1753769.1 4'-phosphopantetheinyl transferase superfamily protein [Streptomyces sp. SP18CS02]